MPLAVSAALGVCFTFAADLSAIRLVGEHAVAVLFALDPVIAAVLGTLLLQEALDPAVVAGILLVSFAGAATLRISGVANHSTTLRRPRRPSSERRGRSAPPAPEEAAEQIAESAARAA